MGRDRIEDSAKGVMPYGRYAGRTLSAIARSDRGLLYLDWVADCLHDGPLLSELIDFLKPYSGRISDLLTSDEWDDEEWSEPVDF